MDKTKILILCVISVLVISGFAVAQGGCKATVGKTDYSSKGRTNGANGVFNDECSNPTQLRKYYCDGDKVKMELHTCGRGCVDGYCREGVSTGTTSSPTTTLSRAPQTTGGCTDSDGGQAYGVKGSAAGINGQKTDRCVTADGDYSTTWLKEYGCTASGYVTSTEYLCPAGCNDGACEGYRAAVTSYTTTTTNVPTTTIAKVTVTSSTTTTTVQAKANVGGCTDSDGGKVTAVKGTTTAINGVRTDMCVNYKGQYSLDYIREFYCTPNGYVGFVGYNCADGCSDGKCAYWSPVIMPTTP